MKSTANNYALSDFDGEVKLYLPNNQNNHASASLSDFNTNFYIKAESIINYRAIALFQIMGEIGTR